MKIQINGTIKMRPEMLVLYIKTKAVISKHFVRFFFDIALFQYLMDRKQFGMLAT